MTKGRPKVAKIWTDEKLNRVKDLEKERKKILKELYKYKKAYQILMEYWDYLPEDGIREEVDKRLKEVKL